MTRIESATIYMAIAIPVISGLVYVENLYKIHGLVEIGTLAYVVIWLITHLWEQIATSDVDELIGRAQHPRITSVKVEYLDDTTKDKMIAALAAENLRLRCDLEEALKWVPYQKGALMMWGKN